MSVSKIFQQRSTGSKDPKIQRFGRYCTALVLLYAQVYGNRFVAFCCTQNSARDDVVRTIVILSVTVLHQERCAHGLGLLGLALSVCFRFVVVDATLTAIAFNVGTRISTPQQQQDVSTQTKCCPASIMTEPRLPPVCPAILWIVPICWKNRWWSPK